MRVIVSAARAFALGAVAAVFLIWQERRRSLHSRNQVDLIDKADYRHIDR